MADKVAGIQVKLTARDSGFRRDMKRAQGSVRSFGRASVAVQGQVRALAGAIAGIFAARGLARGLASSVRAFAVQEEAVKSLEAALKTTGDTGVNSLAKITEEAARLQRITVAADEDLIKASATLKQLAPSLDADDLVKAQRSIIAIADTFLKGDVQNAALLLGKTLGSTTNALTRYGIQVDASATAGEKLLQVVDATRGMFAVSTAVATTFAGSIKQLRNWFGDMQETVGEALVPTLNVMLASIKNNAGAFENLANKMASFISTTAALFGLIDPERQGFIASAMGQGVDILQRNIPKIAAELAIATQRAAELGAEVDKVARGEGSLKENFFLRRTAEQAATARHEVALLEFQLRETANLINAKLNAPGPTVPGDDGAVTVVPVIPPGTRDFIRREMGEVVGGLIIEIPAIPVIDVSDEELRVNEARLAAWRDDTAEKLDFGKAAKEIGYGVGEDLVTGIIQGTLSFGDILKRALIGFAGRFILGPFAGALGIFSPSRVFAEYGRQTMAGYIKGIGDTAGAVTAAVRGVVPMPDVSSPAPSSAFSDLPSSGGSLTAVIRTDDTSNHPPWALDWLAKANIELRYAGE